MVASEAVAIQAIVVGRRGDGRVLAVLLFAVAISIDGFAAGIAEGLRGIRVPAGSLVVMNVVSAVVVLISLSSGQLIAGLLNPLAAKLIGGGILIGLGAWTLGRRPTGRPSSETENQPCEEPPVAISAKARGIRSRGLVKALAMVPGFLDEPALADLDSSGILTPGEAFLLGLALAIDALGVGFGAGMAGLSGAVTAVVAGVTQFIFVGGGLTVGRRIRTSARAPGLERLPGGLLILLGILRLR